MSAAAVAVDQRGVVHARPGGRLGHVDQQDRWSQPSTTWRAIDTHGHIRGVDLPTRDDAIAALTGGLIPARGQLELFEATA